MKGRVANEFLIQFSGLKIGAHAFDYELDASFFAFFDGAEIDESQIAVRVVLEKMESMMQVQFDFSGWAQFPCDRCGDPVKIPVEGSDRLVVKFGEEGMENTDDILVLPPSEFELDLRPHIYEFVVLALPLKRAHDEKACNPETLKALDALRASEDEDNIDPRWEGLKKLKDN